MFYQPKSLEELQEFMSKKGNKDFYLSGGTDWFVKNYGNSHEGIGLIDLTRIRELKAFETVDNQLRIGCGVTFTEIEKSLLCQKEWKVLSQCASQVGSQQIRNRGTIGGNIANGSASADMLSPLLTYESEVCFLDGEKGLIVVRLKDYLEKIQRPPENPLVWIGVKKKGGFGDFFKLGERQSMTIAQLNGCVWLDISIEGEIKNTRCYVGCLGDVPIPFKALESVLIKKSIEEIQLRDYRELIRQFVMDAIPNRSSKEFKKDALVGLLIESFQNIRKDWENER